MGQQGYTVAQLCVYFGVTKITFYNWVNKNKEFGEAFLKYQVCFEAFYDTLIMKSVTDPKLNAKQLQYIDMKNQNSKALTYEPLDEDDEDDKVGLTALSLDELLLLESIYQR